VEGKQPLYRLSGRQYVCIERMKIVVGRDKEQDWLDEMASDDGDSDDDYRLDKEQEEALEGHVLQFMLSLLDHVLGDSEYTSALISGMAVLGISAESGWLDLLVYTPKQSAVVTTSRMLVLYQSTQMQQEQVDKLTAKGWGLEDAAGIAPPYLQFVQEIASHFITLTEYNGKLTLIDSILQLQAFRFKI
jgi:hypothetical protein